MITYDEYVKGAEPNVNDMSKKALYERGKYLVEVIDKNTPLDKFKLVDSIGRGMDKGKHRRIVIPYSPSSGKTTAVRQLVVDSPTFGVYSTRLIDDIDSLYYDVKANQTYSGRNGTKVIKFSTTDKHTVAELRQADWILCTHRRILMEPSSILTMHSDNNMGITVNRNFFIVDEYPSNVYYYITNEDALQMDAMDRIVHKQGNTGLLKTTLDNDELYRYRDTDELSESMARKYFIKHELDSDDPNMYCNLLNGSNITPVGNGGFSDVRKLSKSSTQYEYQKERLSFFADHFIKKFKRQSDQSKANMSRKLYYSLADLSAEVPITVLDGTGDLILGKIPAWHVSDNDSALTTRRLNLNSLSLVETYMKRSQPVDEIVDEYVSVLEKVVQNHPNENVVAYAWKFSKDNSVALNKSENNDQVIDEESNSIKSKILSKLSDQGINNVKIVTYMSGEERGSNRFANCSIAVILGEFYIPNSVINDMNQSLKGDEDCYGGITAKDYTLSLLIQFIYRTRARKHVGDNSVSLYIDHRYEELVYEMYKCISITGVDENEIKPVISDKIHENRIVHLKECVNSGYMMYDENYDVYLSTTEKLAEMFSLKKGRKDTLLKKVKDNYLGSPIVVPRVGIKGSRNQKITVYVFSPYTNFNQDEDVDRSMITDCVSDWVIKTSDAMNKD